VMPLPMVFYLSPCDCWCRRAGNGCRLWLPWTQICYKLGRTIRISGWFAMAPTGVSIRNFLALTGLLAGLLLAAPASAQSVYVASGVPVDVTGDAATLRDQAVLTAQRDALKK